MRLAFITYLYDSGFIAGWGDKPASVSYWWFLC